MRWFFLDAAERLRFARRNPGYTLRMLTRELTLSDERFLASLLGVGKAGLRRYLDEPVNTPVFFNGLGKNAQQFRQASITSAALYGKKVLLQYAAMRALRPRVVVETGVASGVSTSYILLAMHKNGVGTLHSIEMGDASFLPPGKEPGWLVPDWLRERWKLHLADARVLLQSLLEELGQVDAFIHDSFHTYEHMRFEFEQAYPHLRPGGLLLADDAQWNKAFDEFAAKVGAQARILRGVGYCCKPLLNEDLKKCQ